MLTSSSIDAADKRDVTLDTPVSCRGAFGVKIGATATKSVDPDAFCKWVMELEVLSRCDEVFVGM